MNKKNDFLLTMMYADVSGVSLKDYQSSALDAEKMFASCGIKLPFKIYYEYKLPVGLKPLGLLSKYGRMYMAQVYQEYKKFINFDEYSKQEIEELEKYISQKKDSWKSEMGQIVQDIKRLNPELANISINTASKEEDFVRGVVFGFSPEDINYFLNRTSEQACMDNSNKEYYGVGHIVAPQFRDALKQAMVQIEAIKSKQNNGKE